MPRAVTAEDPLPHPWPKDRKPRHLDDWLRPGVAPAWGECHPGAFLDSELLPVRTETAQSRHALVLAEVERRRHAEQAAADRQPATQGDIREMKALIVELARLAGVAK